MAIGGDGKGETTELSVTREGTKAQIFENLISAGVLLRSEITRYGKVLDSYDNLNLERVLIASHWLREATGEILT